MRNLIAILSAVVIFGLSACAQNKVHETKDNESKSVVVYFSATGTTKSEAQLIADAENATLIEIVPEEAYTDADLDWRNKRSRSSLEMNDNNSRPAIRPIDFDFSKCDTVFIGYPIWWNLAPRVVNTFIESVDLKGKTIIPFATSGGSTIGNSVRQLTLQYPDLNWQEGKLLNDASASEVKTWTEHLANL